jgi:hypothetical protein
MDGETMIYMKHATLGNEHFEDAEQAEREAEGWVRWPRTKEQKAATSEPQSVVSTRAGLLADAEALEIKVDRRWSDARLADEIRKVEKSLNE